MRFPTLCCAIALTLASGAVLAEAPAPTAAKPVEIQQFTGYADIPWGTRWEVVKKRFPDATELAEGKSLGANPIGGPLIHRLELTKQAFPGLNKPVTVELRFWKKKLWGFVVYFGDNTDDEVSALLYGRLGPQDSTEKTYPIWKKDLTQTSADFRVRWFSVTDTPLSLQAQEWFQQLLTGQWKGVSQAELDEVEDRTPAPSTPAAK